MIDRARAAALEVLRSVREDDAYANLVLPQILHGFGLTGRDAAFATELAYGTLRWRGWYDAVLASCVTRDWSKVEPALQDVLRRYTGGIDDHGVRRGPQRGHLTLGITPVAGGYLCCKARQTNIDRKSTRLNSSHSQQSRMPSSA